MSTLERAETFSGKRSSYRRVVLLGFMASGKSVVGSALAAALGWEHVDLDAEIERAAGRSIEAIFAEGGEAAFRRWEVELTPRYLAREGIVLSPGGGWVTNPGLLEALPADTLTVWLRVAPAEIVRRLDRGSGQRVRPLLAGDDREGRITRLLEAREPLYGRANVAIETERRSVAEIVRELMEVLEPGRAAGGEGRG